MRAGGVDRPKVADKDPAPVTIEKPRGKRGFLFGNSAGEGVLAHARLTLGPRKAREESSPSFAGGGLSPRYDVEPTNPEAFIGG